MKLQNRLSYAILAAGIFLCSSQLHAADDDTPNFNARISAEADYKIIKTLHIFASEEIRLGGKEIMARSYTAAGFSYKFNQYLKAAVSYTAIAVNRGEAADEDVEAAVRSYEWRHRISGDITGSVQLGQWRLSLRERIQGTYKNRELNNFQQPQTGWVLRSRLKASCRFRTVPLEPYAYFEPRLLLNGAKWSKDGYTQNYGDAEFLGHKDVYFNRLRGAIGLNWKLNSSHSLDLYCLYDHLYDKDIDARKEGSSKGPGLKAGIVKTTDYLVSIGAGYKFSF